MSTKSHFIGPIPPQTFLDTFMEADCNLTAPSVDFSAVAHSQSQRDAQEAFIKKVEESQICPSDRFFLPKLKRRQADAFRVRKKGAGEHDQHEEDAENEAENQIPSYPSVAARRHTGKKLKGPRKVLSEYYNFATASLGIEITPNCDGDPFDAPMDEYLRASDSPVASTSGSAWNAGKNDHHLAHELDDDTPFEPFERDSLEARVARLRILKSTHAIFERQHRCFLFYLVLVGSVARFLLLDRSGAVVSQRFDYIQSPELLAEFLQRYSHMDDASRGFDCTAAPATQKETALFTGAIRDLIEEVEGHDANDLRVHAVPHAQRSLDSTDTYPVWTLNVANGAGGDSTKLVVCRPFAAPDSLFGRSTRAYLAYDLKGARLVFFKDTWRAKDTRLRPEFDIFQDLHAHRVPFVPDVLYGGDVLTADGEPQQTIIDEISAEYTHWKHTEEELPGYVHHRIVQEILFPLEAARSERELIQALHDALLAIEKMDESLGILHRDISNRNIMLDQHGRCALNDWDHAGLPIQDGGAVGTAPFMSIRLLRALALRRKGKQRTMYNELVDDLQSIFWVFNYVAILRFAQHFEGLQGGLFADGEDKNLVNITTAKIFSLGDRFVHQGRYDCPVLTALLCDVAQAWNSYEYARTGSKDELPVFKEPDYEMLELCKRPGYWRGKFAAALEKYDANPEATHQAATPEERTNQNGDRSGTEPVRTGRKRDRADEDVSTVSEDVERGLRRSKRLKAMHERGK